MTGRAVSLGGLPASPGLLRWLQSWEHPDQYIIYTVVSHHKLTVYDDIPSQGPGGRREHGSESTGAGKARGIGAEQDRARLDTELPTPGTS